MKQSNEQTVKATHPSAYAERFRTRGGHTYYLIFTGQPRRGRLSEGKTAAGAWAAAARLLARPASASSADEPVTRG